MTLKRLRWIKGRRGRAEPVFDIPTSEGPCLPDFLISAKRGGETVRFVIEVMGLERAEYLKGKEVTHPRM